MSFRVKITHASLKPDAPPEQKVNMSFLHDDDDNDTFNTLPFLEQKTEQQRQSENRPKQGSDQGMAIRTVPSAQADHM